MLRSSKRSRRADVRACASRFCDTRRVPASRCRVLCQSVCACVCESFLLCKLSHFDMRCMYAWEAPEGGACKGLRRNYRARVQVRDALRSGHIDGDAASCRADGLVITQGQGVNQHLTRGSQAENLQPRANREHAALYMHGPTHGVAQQQCARHVRTMPVVGISVARATCALRKATSWPSGNCTHTQAYAHTHAIKAAWVAQNLLCVRMRVALRGGRSSVG